ncbi:unnamed protein product, partial [Musa acuminata subsp. burmannicoides]
LIILTITICRATFIQLFTSRPFHEEHLHGKLAKCRLHEESYQCNIEHYKRCHFAIPLETFCLLQKPQEQRRHK